MKSYKYHIVCLGLVLVTAISCGKKMIPSVTTTNKQGISYNEAAFNYVYVEGIKQKLMGNGGEALKYFEQSLEIYPGSDAVYYQMAQIVVAKGDIKNGKKYVTKAISIDEKNLWYLMMLAGIYYQEKNLDSAIIYYEKAVKYFPENISLQLNLGNLYSENKNFDKAIEIFDAFDNNYGINETSTLASIKTLIAASKYDDALIKIRLLLQEKPDEILYNGLLAEIYKGMGDTGKAMEVYDKLIERNPDNAQVQLSLCDFLISEKNFDEIFRILNTIVLNSNVTREDKISLFAKLIEIPDLIQDKKDNLMINLMVLEANYSDDEIIPLLRPELLIKQGKLSDAALRLENIIKVNPDNYYAWEKILFVYLQMGDFKNLMIRGEECSTRFNRSFVAKVLYANGALESGKYTIALEELRKAEILAGDNKDFMVQVLTMRADVYYRMKDYTKSFEVFDEALKYNNEDLTVINNYAYYLAEQNIKLKEAEEMARKVIEKEKGNTTYLDTYGWILYKRGKLKEASKVMESIINSGEKPDAVWYEHYGYILKKQRKCPEAIENWNISLKLDGTKTDLIKEIENCGK
jgi:Tfp pilus assembly protein PilF